MFLLTVDVTFLMPKHGLKVSKQSFPQTLYWLSHDFCVNAYK